MKKFLFVFCLVICSLFVCNSCGKSINKDWREVYTIKYTNKAEGTDTKHYWITSKADYEKLKAQYGDYYLRYEIKSISVKFENSTCFVKIIMWSNEEGVLEWDRKYIDYIEYL